MAAILLFAVCPAAHALVSPYTPDANTIYLYHMNEAAGASAAVNAGSAGFSAISYTGDPYAGDGIDQPTVTTVLGGTGFSGFGNAANLSAANNLGLGVDVSGNGGFQLDDNDPLSNDRLLTHASILGTGNAFTIDAMINLPAITGSNREIVATDNSDGNGGITGRGIQFRVNTAGALEFHFIGGGSGGFTVPIPTTGDNAFVANQWFHAAAVYSGTSVQLYWTKVDAAKTSAAPLGAASNRNIQADADLTIVIGNEGRVLNTTGSTEGLLGLIDEVRISNVARNATQFIFNSGLLACDVDGANGCTIDDFNIIKSNFFKTGQTRSQGDLNADGTVEFADFRIWKAAAGPGFAGVTLAGIPEPGSAALLAIGSFLVVLVRRRATQL